MIIKPTRRNFIKSAGLAAASAPLGGIGNGSGFHPRPAGESLVKNCQELERNVIERALVNCGYSRTHAANALGISRVTLYKKMKKYGLMEVPAT